MYIINERSYEFGDFETQLGVINFDSYMIPEDELELANCDFEVDNYVVLPINTHIRALQADVYTVELYHLR